MPVMRKLFLFALLPLILAFFTKAGPERVYLPLTVVFVIIGAAGAVEVWKRVTTHRKWLVVIFTGGILLNYSVYPEAWKLPVPAAEMRQVIVENDESVLPVIASTSGFPVLVNTPEIAKKVEDRSVFPAQLLMLGCGNGVFNGADISNSEQEMTFPVSGVFHPGKVPGYMYKLAPVEHIFANETVLVIFAGRAPVEFLELPGKKLRLNLWLNQRCPIYICYFTTAELPYFEGGKYFRIGDAK